MLDVLLDHAWMPALVWAMLYISDYSLTIANARRYQAQGKLAYEGSYEITPIFQADVDALRRISPRFLILLCISTGYVWYMGTLNDGSDFGYWWYYFMFGMLILTEAAVHTRHFRSWYQLSRVVREAQGRIEFPRGPMLRASAFELLVFAGLYALLWVVVAHPFVLGGAVACVFLSFRHYRLARRHEAKLRGELTAA